MNLNKTQNLICATILTGVFDVNRNELLAVDDFEKIKDWYYSILNLELKGIVFHNTFSHNTVEKYQNEYITFVKVDFDLRFNANVFRYLIYQNFIETNFETIDNLFFTDISDVEVVQNPFEQSLFIENPSSLFCGDELKLLDNEWMNDHSTHLRHSIADFADYEQKNCNQTLLNCGIIGGNKQVLQALMNYLTYIHRTFTVSNKTAYTLDMGAFNYIARTKFADNLLHGQPINTKFKKYEILRDDCWFRHK